MLLHGAGVSGNYVLNAFYYNLLLLKVTMYFHYKFLQKRKPQIDSWFLSELHIIGLKNIVHGDPVYSRLYLLDVTNYLPRNYVTF